MLTFVYYLTPDDWDAVQDGGALRMFSPALNNGGDGNEESGHFDVTPYSDRLVAFRSDIIEHQVLPSLRRERIAITVWLYGRAVAERSNPERERLPGPDTIMHQSNGAGKRSNSSLPPPLPLPAEDASRFEERTIFVAIPSYRDEETWPTIQSLVETAHCPERVCVGVVFQVDTTSQEEVRRFTTAEGSGVSIDSSRWNEATNLRTMVLDCKHATGPCYARHLAQTLHRGETYVLQIDSHMRFRPSWDEYLIRQLDKTERPEKSVLTAYPPGYEPPNGPGPDAETRATILVPWKFGDDGMLRQKGRLIDPAYQTGSGNDNIPCLLYAGGFNFFRSSLLDVCPYDAKLHGLFFGEEISLAVRLYTHGYDHFAPPETVCYHLWKRNPLRVREDDDSVERKRREDALEVVQMQLRGIGRGLGTERTVEQFCRDLGVNFEKKTLAPGCENGGLGKDAFISTPSLSANTGGGGAKDCTNLSGEDMNSMLKLVGQYMATA
ncbi:hypothetical protein ACHAXT_011255 [Thalassiosira profunda]